MEKVDPIGGRISGSCSARLRRLRSKVRRASGRRSSASRARQRRIRTREQTPPSRERKGACVDSGSPPRGIWLLPSPRDENDGVLGQNVDLDWIGLADPAPYRTVGGRPGMRRNETPPGVRVVGTGGRKGDSLRDGGSRLLQDVANAARRGMRPDRGKDRNSFGRKWHLYSPPGVDGRRTCSLASFWKGRGVRGGFRNGRHLRRRPGLETTSLSSARRSSREKERSRRPVGFLEWCGGFGWIDLSRGDSGSQLGLGLRASTIIPLMIESEGRDELLSARRGGVVELVGPVGRGAVLRRSSSIEGARRRRGREGSFTDWREESQETEDPDDEAGRGLRERIRRTSVAASGIFSLIKDRVTARRELGWGSAQQMPPSDNEEGETVR